MFDLFFILTAAKAITLPMFPGIVRLLEHLKWMPDKVSLQFKKKLSTRTYGRGRRKLFTRFSGLLMTQITKTFPTCSPFFKFYKLFKILSPLVHIHAHQDQGATNPGIWPESFVQKVPKDTDYQSFTMSLGLSD